MLSETPATIASSRRLCAVRTSPTMRAARRSAIGLVWWSSRTFHRSFMPPTVSGRSRVSLRCHDVRSLSYPSVSQFAFAGPCAPRLAVNPAVAMAAATTRPALPYDMRAPAARLRTRARDERLARAGSLPGGLRLLFRNVTDRPQVLHPLYHVPPPAAS